MTKTYRCDLCGSEYHPLSVARWFNSGSEHEAVHTVHLDNINSTVEVDRVGDDGNRHTVQKATDLCADCIALIITRREASVYDNE